MQKKYALLPLRDAVVFPYASVTFKVGRNFSKKAIEKALRDDSKQIVVVAQKSADIETPGYEDVFAVGTLCTVLQVIEGPGGVFHVFLEGEKRVQIEDFSWNKEGFIQVDVEPLSSEVKKEKDIKKLRSILEGVLINFTKNMEYPQEFINETIAIEDDARFIDFVIVGFINLKVEESQRLLGANNLEKRFQQVISILKIELELKKIEDKIDRNVKKKLERGHREYYLNEQITALKNELRGADGEDEPLEEEELAEKIANLDAPDYVKQKLWEENERLDMLPPMSSESGVIRTYIDTLLALPWNVQDAAEISIDDAEQVLDDEHFGLVDVKNRVLEYLAVLKLSDSLKAPIICLVGPPGVGKTSIASSIAKATGRKFVRQALGGIKDEAEIRGHRRTYIGALPGKIVQSLKKVQVNNPLFLLDEIDKLSSDYKGDPSSALLEVLDPEQNDTFIDHYLDLEFDLSNVLFVATANDESMIPRALRDRLEIIRVEGYTYYEKKNIATKYLVKKQKEYNGIPKISLQFTEKGMASLIDSYTCEAGVRELERKIASICRKIALEKARGESRKRVYRITDKNIESLLGPAPHSKGDENSEDFEIGTVNGLAWTPYGGSVLKIEAITYPGKGNVKVTGSLGDVMKESVEIAWSFIRSISGDFLGVKESFFEKNDLHIHFPEGAIPKDGPSAGTAISLAIASVISGFPIKPAIAMTGEVTLRGHVLKIGGLRAKVMAAKKAGIRKIYIPWENLADLKEIPEEITEGIDFVAVKSAHKILKESLLFKKNVTMPKKVNRVTLQQ